MTTHPACPLCDAPGGRVLWQGRRARVIAPDEPAWPGLLRVVWNRHVAELTDLPIQHREHALGVVYIVESTLRAMLRPDKINLASLGNQVPHLHWHVIPRWHDDQHFPDPIWAASRRALPPGHDARRQAAAALEPDLARRLTLAFPW